MPESTPRPDVHAKLSRARTQLILDKPFIGALVLRLPLVEADPGWCKTVATDARAFYYNADYIAGLSPGQTQFMLAHEALHCALSHFARREHRVRHCWDVACDYAVNPLLLGEGLEAPHGILYEAGFEGMAAEEIYPFVQDMDTEEPLDTHLYDQEQSDPNQDGTQERPGESGRRDTPGPSRDEGEAPNTQARDGGAASEEPRPQAGGAAQPPPLTQAERETLSVQWQQRLAGAAQQAMQAGKLGGAMARLVDDLIQPRLPWRMLLARYLSNVARDDYSYLRPSNRRTEAAVFPSLRSAQAEIVVALDISGSVSDQEMREFVSEVDAIKGAIRAGITLLACDAELAGDGPWRYEPWEAFALPEVLHGGGGTRFAPVFEWVARQDRQPDLVVYFTDAQGEFPSHEPPYPVIWLVKGKAGVPWGRRIQLN